MDILAVSETGIVSGDALTALVLAILKAVAFCALAVAFIGIVATCWCCLFECRKWRRCHGQSEAWRLMH